MSRYANGTQVAIERTEAEIRRTLIRYGADDVVMGQSSSRGVAFVQFLYAKLRIEARPWGRTFAKPSPAVTSRCCRHSRTGQHDSEDNNAE